MYVFIRKENQSNVRVSAIQKRHTLSFNIERALKYKQASMSGAESGEKGSACVQKKRAPCMLPSTNGTTLSQRPHQLPWGSLRRQTAELKKPLQRRLLS